MREKTRPPRGLRGALVLVGLSIAACGVGVTGRETPSSDGGPLPSGIPTTMGTPPTSMGTADGSVRQHPAGDDGSASLEAGADDEAGDDASDDASDGASDGAATMDATPVVPPQCANVSGPCVVVPAGWALVAFAPQQTAPCPAGFDAAASQDLFEGPSAAGACTCGACTVKQSPTCGAGPISLTYDDAASIYGGTCNQAGNPSPLANSPPGSCGTDIYQGIYAEFDVNYAAPPASGGTCTSPGMQKPAAVKYAAHDRICTANDPASAGCSGGVCQPNLSGPYGACIAAPGDVPCPAGPLDVAHRVGTSATATCGACPCSVTAKCSGTLTLYTDTSCKKASYAVPTDTCVGIASLATYNAYKYTGAAPKTVACQAAAAPPPAFSVAGEQTVCCAQ